MPFEWGKHDCTTHLGHVTQALTGENVWEHLEGTYNDVRGAAKILRDQYGGTLRSALHQTLGEAVHPAKARDGDIAFYTRSCGVMYGNGALFVGCIADQHGLIFIPRGALVEAYPVR